MVVDAAIALIYAGQTGIFNVACDGKATIQEIAELIGLNEPHPSVMEVTAEDLRTMEKIYLVNNIMCLNKLKNFYKPPKLRDEILRCHEIIKNI